MSQAEALIQIRNLSYKPLGADHNILKSINLEINRGDFILLLGPPGCGKSMLTRCLNGLIPHLDEGEMEGNVLVMGKDTQQHEIHEFANTMGMVFQNPDDQIVSLKVVDEVAWGVENQGLPHEEIVRRVDETMDLLSITYLKDRLTFAISGGQKQKVSIASNLAMQQEILILDDPTTDLDPICKMEVVQTLAHLHREMGKTLIVIEHDLNDLIELATRIVILEDGCVILDGSPVELFTDHMDDLLRLGINIPQQVEIAQTVINYFDKAKTRCPTLKDEAFNLLKEHLRDFPLPKIEDEISVKPKRDPVISVQNVDFNYRPEVPLLKSINFEVFKGEFVAIVGANGSGKSTLVNNFTGLLTPTKGRIVINDHDTQKTKINDLNQDIGYVFQNPDHQLFGSTVLEEVGFSLRIRKISEDEIQRRVEETLKTVDLWHLRDRHPFSLSRGQRQKLAVATALIHQPSVILLDEPTTGQDRMSLAGLLSMMTQLNKKGNTTIMVTHDMDIVAAYATRVLVMEAGQIVMDGRPVDIFYDQFGKLNELNLRPPTVVDFCHRLEQKGMPRFLVVEELLSYLKEVALSRELSA